MQKVGRISKEDLKKAVSLESAEFEQVYHWLENHMPPSFFDNFNGSEIITIVHNLMGFNVQDHFVEIHFKSSSIVICLDSFDADLRILKNYTFYGVKGYQTFISNAHPPFDGIKENLRIALIHYTEIECDTPSHEIATKEELEKYLPPSFLKSLNKDRLQIILDMFFKARSDDQIQCEVKYNEAWKSAEREIPSMQIVFAWRNTQKYNFLYRLAKLLFRHNLTMKRVSAAYVQLDKSENVLLMSLGVHGLENKAAWEVTDIDDFLKELTTLKYFEDNDLIESTFVDTKLVRGNIANLIRIFLSLSHQLLLHVDPNLYSLLNIEESLVRHPELTIELTRIFELKFHPIQNDFKTYEEARANFLGLLEKLDTGNLTLDNRRKSVLKIVLSIIHHLEKTNFYKNNKSAFSFRLNPLILNDLPFDRTIKFPEIPFGIFFVKGKSFFAFHIRFKDLSRGGIRTILPYRKEQAHWERMNIFSECYNLSYTQQKKNKDIPEGGAKGVIFVEPFDELEIETKIYKRELSSKGLSDKEIDEKIQLFQKDKRLVYLYQSQRAFVESILTIVNCEDDGTLKTKDVIDYYKKPEYLYFGPDENMHNSMIDWISAYSKKVHYKPGIAFISSKPKYGINHKEFGVTSFGVNTYMHKALESIGINPLIDEFTIKISGGPDGDVAGNQMYNLLRFYPKTAKLLAITDISGTMFDPKGFDLLEIAKLFHEGKSIRYYPKEKLHDGGFILDLQTKRDQSAYAWQTLLIKMEKGKLHEHWLNGNETHHLYSHNLHKTVTDIFVPAGGRPRTLNKDNWIDFLTPDGYPTSKAIVEGANLYLTPDARCELEKKGVLIIKDSSANKGGVICSSLEVLSGLILSEEEFLKEKSELIKEILSFIEEKASLEADLLLSYKNKKPLTEISDLISKRINTFTSQILEYLETYDIMKKPNDPLKKALIDYCLPLFKTKYQDRILDNIPRVHQNAIIACRIASEVVYKRGLNWTPTIVDVLPIILG
jgi:glutamate dehydrogenase